MTLPGDIEIAVFDAARQIEDPAMRNAFLDWAFRDSPEDGARMKDLLASEVDALSWFEDASATRIRLSNEVIELGQVSLPADNGDPVDDLGLPELIGGRFMILSRLGQGGGGMVFLAEQTEPVRRQVAIKLLHVGMDTAAFLTAFQRERQVLALMNHPNIAGIIDAGSTEAGTPYFVMEFVEGERITRFCDERRDTIQQRIQLFLQICSAIQHAHQKGVIHRDVKPSNIIVSLSDSVPHPKVIDFGIAAAIAKRQATDTAPLPAGTPAYMSPEQAASSGTDVDTRADVFSLGVLLYELLAGAVPWSPGPMPPSPPRPSEHLASLDPEALADLAAHRQLRPEQLISNLRGDLDAIILKATAADRQQRYDTANSLAMDLRRHMGHLPVVAHPPGKRYLLRKFIRRNRLACLSGAGILVTLLIASALSFSSFLRERQARMEAEHARAIAATMLKQSKIRETVATAAVLLNENRTQEANSLLLNISYASVEPTLEAANVFRFLGARYALRNQWQEASECFSLLIKTGRLRSAEDVAANLDLLYAAPAFVECGKWSDYDALCREILTRLPATKNPIAAEHVVKICLLRPTDPGTLRSLQPMIEVLRQNFERNQDLWFAMAIALFHHRSGDFEEALKWTRKCLETQPEPIARLAAVKIISAMALHRLSRPEEARRDFSDAVRMIEDFTQKKPSLVEEYYDSKQGVMSYDTKQGTWYAWAVARILRREADAVPVSK